MSVRLLGRSLCVAAFLLCSRQPSRAAEASQGLIEGIDLASILQLTLPSGVNATGSCAQRRGVSSLLVRGAKPVGRIEAGVFADASVARQAFEEHKRLTSAPPDTELIEKLGDMSVGWGKRRVLWLRQNVVVSLSLPEDMLESTPFAIDKLLVSGAVGVRRGKVVPVPQIVDVEVPAKVIAGTTVPIKVTVVVAEGANHDLLGIADRHGVSVTGAATKPVPPGEVRMVYTFEYAAMRLTEGREESYWICYATAGCVVTSRKVTISIEPK